MQYGHRGCNTSRLKQTVPLLPEMRAGRSPAFRRKLLTGFSPRAEPVRRPKATLCAGLTCCRTDAPAAKAANPLPPKGPVALFGLKAHEHLSLGQRPRSAAFRNRTLKAFLTVRNVLRRKEVRNTFSVRNHCGTNLGRCPRLRWIWAFSPADWKKATGPKGGTPTGLGAAFEPPASCFASRLPADPTGCVLRMLIIAQAPRRFARRSCRACGRRQ